MQNSQNNLPSGVWSLSSGSKANCTLVSDGESAVLIDLGVSFRFLKTTLTRIGIQTSDVSAVFITHEHIDHTAGLNTFIKNCDIPVHMAEASYISLIRGRGFEYRDKITVHTDMTFTETVGKIKITSLPVRHDSAACLAYKLTGSGLSVGICTDTGRPSSELFDFFSDCRDIITEANHDTVMLKCGIYPDDLKYRILSEFGHTSNEDCAAFVSALARKNVKNVMLAHISPENNTPELAVYTVKKRLEEDGVSLLSLTAAPRSEMLKFV